MKCADPSHSAPGRFRYLVSFVVLWLLVLSGKAIGQVGVDDYPKPILTRNGLSHYAPIKDLVFAPGGKELLSAGLDKVIHVWDLEKRSTRPIHTIRPPIFKGELGQIRSIAISPVEEVEGQRFLAVAGHSPGTDIGTIVLMRYPGKDPVNPGGRGELLGYLQNPKGRDAKVEDLTAKISKLAFTRDGRFLVSADFAGSINVWDLNEVGKRLNGIEAVSKLEPLIFKTPLRATSAITGMVIAGDENDDRWVITGADDGRIHRHDLKNPQAPVELARIEGDWIVCLGGGGKLPWVVAGTNRGRIVKIAINDRLVALQMIQGTPGLLGRILAVDVSADGAKIAVTTRNTLRRESDPPPIDGCVVGLYETNDGRTWRPRTIARTRFPVEAVRFGLGTDRLAFGGDEDQAVTVLEGPKYDNTQPTLKIPGQGSVIWDVGFVDQGLPARAIVYSRNSQDYSKSRGTGPFRGFDLTGRSPNNYPTNRVFRPYPERYSIRIDAREYHFDLVNTQVNGIFQKVDLEPNRDGRWYSYLLLPPQPGKMDYLLAVGTEFGISIFNLSSGKRTRFLEGHEAAVTALGVSSDGKWLVSGSVDQSIRLWAVKDFDKVIGFGATARLNGGQLEVISVNEGSVAYQRGLREKDIITRAYIDQARTGNSVSQEVRLDQFIDLAEKLQADQEIRLVGTDNKPLNFYSKKRQPPTLSLFLENGASPEYIVWAPQGFYATSIQGDDRYLGWHQNLMVAARPDSLFFPDTERTAFAPISAFKNRFENRGFIDQLIASKEPPPPPPPPPIMVETPPKIEKTKEGPIIATVPVNKLKPGDPIIKVFVNGSPVSPELIKVIKGANSYVATINQKAYETFKEFQIAAKLDEEERKSPLVIGQFQNQEHAPPTHPGRLLFFCCAVESAPRLKNVKVAGASRDAEDLWEFFRKKVSLISPTDGEPFLPENRKSFWPRGVPKNRSRFEDPTTANFEETFDELERKMGLGLKGQETPDNTGDVLVMHLEAPSLFGTAEADQILLGDWKPGQQTQATAEFILKRLRDIVGTGCRVYLFLDIVHERTQDIKVKDAREQWIRQLLDAGVTCFMASKDKPSWPIAGAGSEIELFNGNNNRLFAASILKMDKSGRLTFQEFVDEVKTQSKTYISESDFDPDFFNYWIPQPLNEQRSAFITNQVNRLPKR